MARKISSGQRLSVVGFIALLHNRRREVDSAEQMLATVLRDLGAQDADPYHNTLSAVQEATYNPPDDIDDAEQTADWLLKILGLEVE